MILWYYEEWKGWFAGVVDKVGRQIIEVHFEEEDKYDTLHVKAHKIRACK